MPRKRKTPRVAEAVMPPKPQRSPGPDPVEMEQLEQAVRAYRRAVAQLGEPIYAGQLEREAFYAAQTHLDGLLKRLPG